MNRTLIVAILLAVSAQALAQDFPRMRWDPGTEDCTPAQQRTEAHAYDETTIIIRQNPCVDPEANFLYLLIGEERALLIDSGASDDPRITAELTALVSEYLEDEDSRLPLVVAHTHSHGDHTAGDAAFAALPGTSVVPLELEAMREYFGIEEWPHGGARFDLGNRLVEIIPTPGHHPDHIVFLDSHTRLLFSGDYLLPGRLLVDDIHAYADSALRVHEAVLSYGVRYALGAHIEMNKAGELYSGSASFHPDERELPVKLGDYEARMFRGDLLDSNGFYNRHTDYVIVYPVHNLAALVVAVLAVLAMLWLLVRKLRARRRLQGS